MLKGLQVEIGLWLPLPHSKWSTGCVSHTLSFHFQWAHTIPPLSPLSSPTLDPGSRHFLCLDWSSPKYLYVCSFTSFWSLLKYQLLREAFSRQLLQTYSSQPIRSPIPDLIFPYSTYRYLMFYSLSYFLSGSFCYSVSSPWRSGFCLLLCSQCLVQHLTHSRCSTNCCHCDLLSYPASLVGHYPGMDWQSHRKVKEWRREVKKE